MGLEHGADGLTLAVASLVVCLGIFILGGWLSGSAPSLDASHALRHRPPAPSRSFGSGRSWRLSAVPERAETAGMSPIGRAGQTVRGVRDCAQRTAGFDVKHPSRIAAVDASIRAESARPRVDLARTAACAKAAVDCEREIGPTAPSTHLRGASADRREGRGVGDTC